jgi:hypothetical protein
MNWGAVTMSVMAVFGAASLALNQTTALLCKAADVVRAWRQLRDEVKRR